MKPIIIHILFCDSNVHEIIQLEKINQLFSLQSVILLCVCVCVRVCVCVSRTHAHILAYSCPALCNPVDCIPPGSSVHEIFLARILEWAVISYSRESSKPGNKPSSLASRAGRFFTTSITWKAPGVILFSV